MTQRHLDRLSAVDAGFLHNEGPNAHMHIGGVSVFEGPPPDQAEVLRHVASRLHLLPRYRQRLAYPPLQTGRPVWIDDPSFNLEYHVRRTALPRPGDEGQLVALVSRIASQRLDRTKPLWEMWVVEGLEGDRFALVTKTHHSLIDGISGVDVATVLLDLNAEPGEIPEPEPWVPNHEPGGAELVAVGVRGAAGGVAGLLGRALGAATRPGEVVSRAMETAQALGEVGWTLANPAPATPLNVPIGPHRRFAVVRSELADYKLVKNALGGTVNDVVLSVVAAAMHRWLESRGMRTGGVELRACVPVSTRTRDESGTLGNRITIMVGRLPVGIEDPVVRLRVVRESMEGLKESRQALGADVIANVQNFAPPTILAQASRLGFSSRTYNLLVTNVPGPQFSVYLRGRRMLEAFPLAFLAADHALAIAVVSYDGHVAFGLLGDYDVMHDLDQVAEWIEDALDELVRLAGGRRSRPASRRASANGHEPRPARRRATAANGSGRRRTPAASRKR